MIIAEFILGCNLEQIRRDVVIAPCWYPNTVGISNYKLISDKACKIWECSIDGRTFNYIVSGVGAAACMDIVFALGETKCSRLLFLGSAGALRQGQKVGDFALPRAIISAEGASRYIGNDLSNDSFGKAFYASEEIRNKLYKCSNEIGRLYGIEIHNGRGVSVESIFLQYNHIDELLQMDCDFIDMESSAFLAASNALGITSAVVFCISDNVAQSEPLYTVAAEKTAFRKRIRKKIVPRLLKEFTNEG
nr:hypothetical protein [uncultured Blautia sp.]